MKRKMWEAKVIELRDRVADDFIELNNLAKTLKFVENVAPNQVTVNKISNLCDTIKRDYNDYIIIQSEPVEE